MSEWDANSELPEAISLTSQGSEGNDGDCSEILVSQRSDVAGEDDLIDKGEPVVWPSLLENGDEYQVKLVDQCSLGFSAMI